MCGCCNKWRGPRGVHEVRGAPHGGGHALDPRGQVVAPSGVFSVPNILKYSTKNHISFLGYLENFYLRGIFLLQGQFRKQTEHTIFALFNLNNRK